MCVPVGFPVGIAAVVVGILGLRGVRRGTSSGRAMALIGVVCGALGIVSDALIITLLTTIDP
jgi:hypothetical protein